MLGWASTAKISLLVIEPTALALPPCAMNWNDSAQSSTPPSISPACMLAAIRELLPIRTRSTSSPSSFQAPVSKAIQIADCAPVTAVQAIFAFCGRASATPAPALAAGAAPAAPGPPAGVDGAGGAPPVGVPDG